MDRRSSLAGWITLVKLAREGIRTESHRRQIFVRTTAFISILATTIHKICYLEAVHVFCIYLCSTLHIITLILVGIKCYDVGTETENVKMTFNGEPCAGNTAGPFPANSTVLS